MAFVLLKAAYVLDVLNTLDEIIGIPGRTPRNETLLQVASRINHAGLGILQDLQSRVHGPSMQALYAVRNKACAHIDRVLSFEDIGAMLDGLDISGLERLHSGLIAAALEFFRADIRSQCLVVHGRTLRGVTGVEKTTALKPFRVE